MSISAINSVSNFQTKHAQPIKKQQQLNVAFKGYDDDECDDDKKSSTKAYVALGAATVVILAAIFREKLGLTKLFNKIFKKAAEEVPAKPEVKIAGLLPAPADVADAAGKAAAKA